MNVIENLNKGGSVGQIQPNSLIHADCLDAMKYIESKSIDMILCDLPYGTTACKWDVVIPFEPLWGQYNRIIKEDGVVALFGSEPFSSYLRLSNMKIYRYDWIWHKNTSGGFATAKKQPMKYHEIISIFYKKQPTYNPQFQPYSESTCKGFKDGQMVNRKKEVENPKNNIQGGVAFLGQQPIDKKRGKYPESVQFFNSIPNCNGTKLHPTQKPVALLEYLIKTYTLEGETVLDNTMGSGSTGVACINTNRNFIGIEKDDKYFEIAKDRIEKAKENLFDL
ncbi:MAG: site-specific DNA-methyltransferase [Lentisphaeria bacterium]